MHIYKYVQAHTIIIIICQHVSGALVTIIRVSYKRNTISIQTIVKYIW